MKRLLTIFLLMSLFSISTLWAGPAEQLATPYMNEEIISLEPNFDAAEFTLTIQGPDGQNYEFRFDGRDVPYFQIEDLGARLDGMYTFSLVARPNLSQQAYDWMQQQRAANQEVTIASLRAQGFIEEMPVVMSGQFRMQDGLFFVPSNDIQEVVATASKKRSDLTAEDSTDEGSPITDADDPDRAQVFATDLVVQGSTCTGFDCVNGESFGFDTLRLKENNLRIHFQDTSNSGSFPTADWRIVANDTTNGGANYLAFEDSNAGTYPFRVLQGAGNNALYVDAQGDVGLNTSNPVVELHISDGDTPTMRLEQNGSSGWTAQTWDVAGNETNFFVRDVTNGSEIPFKIKPGADDNALFIDSDNEIGIGTASPDSRFHIRGTTGDTAFHVQEANGTAADRDMFNISNNGGSRININNTDNGETWKLTTALNSDAFNITFAGTGNREMELSETGDLSILNNITAGGTVTGSSDRNIKENFQPVDHHDILSKVSALEISEWSYIADENGVRHIGPMAQDFFSAFGVGIDDKHISMVDMDGIALASIKALNHKLEEKDNKIDQLEQENKALAEKLSRIESLLERLIEDK